MKKTLRFLLAFLVLAAVTGCQPTVDPGATDPAPVDPAPVNPAPVVTGAPVGLSISGARGVFLTSTPGTRTNTARALSSARDIISSSGSELGAVTATGIPQPATFQEIGRASCRERV